MASLWHAGSGRRSVIEAEHLVGRSDRASLRLEQDYVSTQHALIRWNGQQWEVRDLGSRNGTFLDGVLMQPAKDHVLRSGMTLRFGDSNESWLLEDETPPQVMAVRARDGATVVMEGNILALPSVQDPRATLYRGTNGVWRLELTDESVATIRNQQRFQIDDDEWRFCCPQLVVPTAGIIIPREMRQLTLRFKVSTDEEHVALGVHFDGTVVDLGSRNHNYLLLTLARERIADRDRGLPDTGCGWIYQDKLLHALQISQIQLNIDVFRIRKQFGSLGVVDAASVVERRPRTKQLRVGTPCLVVDRD